MFEIQNLSKVIFLSKIVSPACALARALKKTSFKGQAIFNCLKNKTQNLLQSSKESQMYLPITLAF